MSETMANAGPRRPPWIAPDIQQKIEWRDGDVVISVPPKSGTTWTMNIVYQLLTGGTADFRDIYEEVPWIELLAHPGQSPQEVVDHLGAMPGSRRRAFKTHSAPPQLPFFKSGSEPEVKYIVVLRNPEEALVSYRPFLEKLSDDWLDLWQVPRAALCRPDFPAFYSEVIEPRGLQGAFFGFLAAWWPLRDERNVLFLHFADMKREQEASIRKIARFLGVEPRDAQWRDILTYTSFEWMKRNEDKFELRSTGKVQFLKPGAMIRKGAVGQAKSDGMTVDISRHLRELGDRICPDAAAVDWFYRGGPLP